MADVELTEEFELNFTFTNGEAVRVVVQYNDPEAGLRALHQIAQPQYLIALAKSVYGDVDDEDYEDDEEYL